MLKRLLLAAAILSAVVIPSSAAAAPSSPPPTAAPQPVVTPTYESDVDAKRAQPRPGYRYAVEAGEVLEAAGDVDPQNPGRSSVAGSRPVFFAVIPTIVTRSDGSRCRVDVRRSFPDEASAAAATRFRENWVWLVTEAGRLPCPDPDAPTAAPTPAQEAATYWRVAGEDLLPKPSPRIAPGYMLAGKLAYLESGSQATTRFEHATPIGTLVIEASSQLMVDWGDGSGLTGPHAGPGAPWPNGTITHFWTTAATYDVRVVQRWTGRWSLGGEAGVVDGLETEAVIDDFEVRQLQAVRNS